MAYNIVFSFCCGYSPNVSFSPESGGSVNPNKAIDDISTHGTIKLKK